MRALLPLLLLAGAAAAAVVRERREVAPGVSVAAYDDEVAAAQVDARRAVLADGFDTRVSTARRSATGHYVHRREVDMLVRALGEELHLRLRLNEGLLDPDTFEVVTWAGERNVSVTRGIEHCWYTGYVETDRDVSSNWVALSTCHGGLDAYIELDGEGIHVTPVEAQDPETRRGARHVAYRAADVLDKVEGKCGVVAPEGEDGGHAHAHDVDAAASPVRLDMVHKDEVRGRRTDTPMYNKYLLVNDYSRKLLYNNDGTMTTNTVTLGNLAAQRYAATQFSTATMNLRLIGVTNIAVATFQTQVSGYGSAAVVDSGALLPEFCSWRRTQLTASGNAGTALALNNNAHLLSARPFSSGNSGTIGLGYVSTLCSTTSSCGIEAAWTGTDAVNSATLAHEMGHNFGMQHDSSGNACPQSGFVMQAVINTAAAAPTSFSSCSATYFDAFIRGLGTGSGNCLLSAGSLSYPPGGNCGNYVIDSGEQCDGGVSGNACCTSSCTWKNGAVCDSTINRCCQNCQWPTAGAQIQCQASTGACDNNVNCAQTSVSPVAWSCPPSAKPDGSSCGTGAVCSAGACVSRDSGCAQYNNYQFTINGATVGGPFTSCDTTKCTLSCRGTGSTTCVSSTSFSPPLPNNAVGKGLPCTQGCTTGQTGTCDGNGACLCTASATAPPTTPAPTTTCTRAFCNNRGACLIVNGVNTCQCDSGWTTTVANQPCASAVLPPGCDGVPGSGKVIDACGVCGGNGRSCAGCDGVPNSGKVYDACGVCGGNGRTCAGCDGVPNSGKTYDRCGVCAGTNACVGCDGVPNSGKSYDVCGICGGTGTSCLGCDGVPFSGKVRDVCGVCGGTGSTCRGCDGVPNSGKIVDQCGVCGGSNTACRGCDGLLYPPPQTIRTTDACGVCGGTNSTCTGCDGRVYPPPQTVRRYDVCGVCGGTNSTCRGCDGVPNSGARYDACGQCVSAANPKTCTLGCNGVYYGQNQIAPTVDGCGICGGNGNSCRGCDGVQYPPPETIKVYDACGVCGGTGSTCAGCDGVPNSGARYDRCGQCSNPSNPKTCVLGCNGQYYGQGQTPPSLDACGVCGGNGNSCRGCDGVQYPPPQTIKTYDACGVCGGTGSTCRGCDGVINSGARYDNCGQCVSAANPKTCTLACNGQYYGQGQTPPVTDVCGVCGGSGQSCRGCDGVVNSGKINDLCGVCGGNNTACAGCDGRPNSGLRLDACGVCGGTNSTCRGCDGVINSGKIFDVCNVCGGNGRSCLGCDNVPNSGKVRDVCGVCGGNNATCAGCDGVPFSGKTFDACGVCGGTGSTCRGCDGVINSGKKFDSCGVCGGDGSSCGDTQQCQDTCCLSGKRFDLCNVCGGTNACLGCDSVPNSGKTYDRCGVCGGNGQSCVGCDGVVNSRKQYDACGVCAGNNTACVGCDGVPNSGKVRDACGRCGGDNSTCAGCDGVPNSGKIRDFCGVCGGDGATCNAFQPCPDPVVTLEQVSSADTSEWKFTISGTNFNSITPVVYYTTNGDVPDPLTGIRYTDEVTLRIEDFLPSETPSSTAGRRRRDDSGSQGTPTTQTATVVLQAQSYPPPGSVRLYKSFVTTKTITFQRVVTTGPFTPDGVTPVGAGVIAGAVIGGILGLGLLIGGLWYYFVARRARTTEKAGRAKYRAIYNYQPQSGDELELRENDVIVLHETFGDGWARGYDERSRKTGVFPMDYVVEIDASRLMLVDRPQTVYGRVSQRMSQAFNFGGQATGQLDRSKLPPKPVALPPKPSIPPPTYAQPPTYSSEKGGRNPLFAV